MLVARIKRPGAQLAIDNAPSAPKIEQLTLVRIILPLPRKRSRNAGHAAIGQAVGRFFDTADRLAGRLIP